MQRIRPCPLEGMADQVQLKSKSRKRKHCGHCNEDLSLPVYKRHKNLYYNSQAKTWRQESSGESEGDDDESLFLDLDSSVDGSYLLNSQVSLKFIGGLICVYGAFILCRHEQ